MVSKGLAVQLVGVEKLPERSRASTQRKRLLADELAETLLYAPSCGIPITLEVLLQIRAETESQNQHKSIAGTTDALQIFKCFQCKSSNRSFQKVKIYLC